MRAWLLLLQGCACLRLAPAFEPVAQIPPVVMNAQWAKIEKDLDPSKLGGLNDQMWRTPLSFYLKLSELSGVGIDNPGASVVSSGNSLTFVTVQAVTPDAIQAQQPSYVISENAKFWGTSTSDLQWCEDIFSKGSGVSYTPVPDDRFYLTYGRGPPEQIVPKSLPLLDATPSGFAWRTIRKCTDPACAGCFRSQLRYFMFVVWMRDVPRNMLNAEEPLTVAFGRCKGYQQIDCSVATTCTNGQFANNYAVREYYSQRYMYPVQCQSCPPGTWNTCVNPVRPPLTTCSWSESARLYFL